MNKPAFLAGILLSCSALTSVADQSGVEGTIEFDRNRLYDCYNAGEIVFFRDGRMTYNGDDFTIIEPERWMQVGGQVLPEAEVGVRFTRVDIEDSPMLIQSFDAQGRTELFSQNNVPEAGSELLLTVNEGPVAFSLEFDHDSAGLDVTFELFDPVSPNNVSAMSFGLNCS